MASNMSVKNRINMFEHHSATKNPDKPVPTSPLSNRPSSGFHNQELGTVIDSRSPLSPSLRKGNNARSSSLGGSPMNAKNAVFDWRLDEDDSQDAIPAPNRPHSQHRRSFVQTRSDQQDKPRRYSSPSKQDKASPVILPQRASPVILPQKAVKVKSPFKHIQNREYTPIVTVSNDAEKVESREVNWPTMKKAKEKRDEEPVIDQPSSSMTNDEKADDENQAPEPQQTTLLTEESSRLRSTRALRLMRTKRASSPMRTLETGLKGSLEAAKVVMEEEKSSAGSSTASSRSSLSNNELSNIASRALIMLKGRDSMPTTKQKSVPVILPSLRSLKSRPSAPASPAIKGADVQTENSEMRLANRVSRAGKLTQALRRAGAHDVLRYQSQDTERTGIPDSSQEVAVHPVFDYSSKSSAASPEGSSTPKARVALVSGARRTRTLTNVSHQEARRALLNAAQRKKEKAVSTKKQAEVEVQVQAEKDDTKEGNQDLNEVATRLGFKASRVLAMKNSTKAHANKSETHQDTSFVLNSEAGENKNVQKEQIDSKKEPFGLLTVGSVDSIKSRRLNHPAFAARTASPKPSRQAQRPFPDNDGEMPQKTEPAKPFSEELFSSFRHFNASRNPRETDRIANSPGMYGLSI
jgi:hypothetical protein